jgi:hypothetical protein
MDWISTKTIKHHGRKKLDSPCIYDSDYATYRIFEQEIVEQCYYYGYQVCDQCKVKCPKSKFKLGFVLGSNSTEGRREHYFCSKECLLKFIAKMEDLEK